MGTGKKAGKLETQEGQKGDDDKDVYKRQLLDPVIQVTTLGTKHFFKAPSPQKQSKTNKKTP